MSASLHPIPLAGALRSNHQRPLSETNLFSIIQKRMIIIIFVFFLYEKKSNILKRLCQLKERRIFIMTSTTDSKSKGRFFKNKKHKIRRGDYACEKINFSASFMCNL